MLPLYENPPIPPLPKGGKEGISCFVVPASGMVVSSDAFAKSPVIPHLKRQNFPSPFDGGGLGRG
ncbi:MAG: hypothetical protein C0407_18270 [Desulfobacca sp.]|nr:hypothetical protein [Desulfobacca sp.]